MSLGNYILRLKKFFQEGNRSSFLRMHTGNGYGSTDNKILRYATTVENTGNGKDYIFSDTAANGTTITMQRDCYVFLMATFVGDSNTGFSLNSSELTTSIFSITVGDRLTISNGGGASHTGTSVWHGKLKKGDIVRPHADGSGNTDARHVFVVSTTGLEDLMGNLI